MRRPMRRDYTDEQESKKMLYIAGGVLLLAIVAFVVTFIIYSNVITEESEQPETTITDLATTNAITSQASSSIGKTVNEVEQSETEQSNVVVDANTKNEGTLNESLANKIAINTSAQEKKQITKRLNIIEGQIRGIKQMIEDDRYCDDVLTQMLAVNKALESLENIILERHLQTCIKNKIEKGSTEEVSKEIMDLFKKLR